MKNEDYEELRNHLKELIKFNNKGVRLSDTITTYKDAECKHPISSRKTTIDDYLEKNRNDLIYICDLLGMSDLYLNEKLYKKNDDTILISRDDAMKLDTALHSVSKGLNDLEEINISIKKKIEFQDQNKR